MNQNCLFCPKPDKRTTWWHEDDVMLLINKPSGEPMVVLKAHGRGPTNDEQKHIRQIVADIVGNHEYRVIMDVVKNHHHQHIVNYERLPAEGTDPI